jgi:hypothetical protein
MAREEKIYRRLPGRPFTPIGVSSFWNGPDHLLLVETAFFRERYKRFYYKDIQAVIMHRNSLHRVWTALWSALSLLFGVIAYLVEGTPYTSGTLLAICLSALAVNLLLGPCCMVFLQTAVQRQRLRTLRRVRTAAKAMDRIKVLVEAQQGSWEKEKSIKVHGKQSGAETMSPRMQTTAIAASDEGKKPVGLYKPLLHKILFGLLLAMGVLGAIQLFLKNLPLGLLEALMHSVIQIMVIVTLARWSSHLKGTVISKINWLALILIAFYTVAGYVLYFTVSFRFPEINYHNWAMFKKMFELMTVDHPLALYSNIVYAGGSLLLGVFGMLAVKQNVHRPES